MGEVSHMNEEEIIRRLEHDIAVLEKLNDDLEYTLNSYILIQSAQDYLTRRRKA